MKVRLLATILVSVMLATGGVPMPTTVTAGSNSQISLFLQVTLTLRRNGSSSYVMEGGTSNRLLNSLPCEASGPARVPNARVEESATRNREGVCIHKTSVEFPTLKALGDFLEKGGGYLQEQGEKIALGMAIKPEKPTSFVSASMQYVIRMPAIELYDPLSGQPGNYADGNQVLWKFRSEAELLDLEVKGSLCSCLKPSTNASKRRTIYFGGAGMNGDYIPSQVYALKKECIDNVDAAKRTDGTFDDARHSYSKFRERDKTEDWGLQRSGVNVVVGQTDKLNLVGYSYGSLVAAQTALFYADKGIVTENVVLIGSPISQVMLNQLKTNPKIQNVTVIDLPGDKIHAGMSRGDLNEALLQLGPDFSSSSKKGNGHFYYALEGPGGDKRRAELAERIKKLLGDCR